MIFVSYNYRVKYYFRQFNLLIDGRQINIKIPNYL